MHPILIRKERLILYLLAWIPIDTLFAITLRFVDGWSPLEAIAFAIPMGLMIAFLCLAVWPVCRALPLGRSNWIRIAGAHGGNVVVMVSLWLLAGRLVSGFLDSQGYFPSMVFRFQRAIPLLLVVGSLLLVLSTAVHYLMIAFEKAREAERAALELQVQAREAELSALKAQINPHFLFNSLNSISALAGQDPAARRMAILLSDFLRRSMHLGAREQIALEDELELAADYLAVEQIRFGDRLSVARHVSAEALPCRVPALLLQPLLENAIKHGIAHLVEGGAIAIEASRRAGRLEIAIENPCDPDRPATRGQGLGIANVRKRLANFHPADSRVVAKEESGRHRIEVSLPAIAAAADTPTASGQEEAPATSDDNMLSTPGKATRPATPSIVRGIEPHGL